MKDKLIQRIFDELEDAKKIRDNLLEITYAAEEIGYATQFALETDEETARSAYQAGYSLGVQDGYIDCLQKMMIILEEE